MRYAIIMIVSFLMVSMLGWILNGDDKPAPKPAPIAALIVRAGEVSEAGVGQVSAFYVVATEKLAELEAFFPGYQNRPISEIAGAWEEGYRVYFDFPGGESIRLSVSENEGGRYWSVGRGDFVTRGDFSEFVAGLQE